MSDGSIIIDTKIDNSGAYRDFKSFQREMNNLAKEAKKSGKNIESSLTTPLQKMRDAYKQSQAQLRPFRAEMLNLQYDFFELAQSMKTYSGTNKQFMNELNELGKRHKTITDNMMKNNDMMKASFIQSVAVMVNRSGQSEKIAKNFERMGNPLYTVNNGLLKVTGSLEKMARSGQPAVLALKMLGPTANMKDLYDMTTLITRGLMRFQFVSLAAAAASGVLYTSLFKAAKGPDPSEVYKKQQEAIEEYANAVRERTQEIMETWNLFEDVQLKKTSGAQLTKNLEEQVKTLQTWRQNLANIAQRAGDEFSNYLAKMGPNAAGEVAAIASMSQPELDKYVALWREKMAQARGQAVTELEGMRAETEKKVKELQETLTPLGLALEPMKKAWAEAFKPMVEVFTMISVPIVNFLTLVGEMIVKFNEAHPTLAKIIQGFLMLIPALTLLMSPLAIGIGMFNGMKAAFAETWRLIGPLITGLGAMSGTVLVVAGIIVGLAAAFIYLWNNQEWFRDAVIGAWEAIKQAAITVWNFLYTNVIQPVWNAIVTFVTEQLAKLKAFWDENGQQILEAAQNVWNAIKSVIQVVMGVIGEIMKVLWPVIKEIVISTWEAIKNTVEGAIDVILGIVKFFSSLFTGDWKGVWEGVKQILSGAVQALWGLINLWFIGKFIGGFKAFASSAKAIFTGFWNGAKSLFTAAFTAIRTTITNIANGIKNTLTTIFNAIRNTIKTILNGIKSIATSIWNGIKTATVNVVNAIRNVISSVFNAIKSVITSIFNGIKSIITNTWSNIKSTVKNSVTGVKDAIQKGLKQALDFVKGLGESFKKAGKGLLDMMAAGISAAADKVIGTVKNLAGKVRDFLPFSPAKTGPLSDLDHLDFGGPISDSLVKAMPKVQSQMSALLKLPDISALNRTLVAKSPEATPTINVESSKFPENMQATINIGGYQAQGLVKFLMSQTVQEKNRGIRQIKGRLNTT